MLEFQKETERDRAQHVSPDDNKGGHLGSQEGFSTFIFHKERKNRKGEGGREGERGRKVTRVLTGEGICTVENSLVTM